MEGPSLVGLANERVRIDFVCSQIGMDLPEYIDGIKSYKTICPFGEFYHPDGGHEAAFRVYPGTNSAYCFACSLYFSPVYLYAMAKGLSNRDAASELLDLVGYKKLDFNQEWERVATVRETVDEQSLAEALKVYCSRIVPGWDERQFHPEVSSALSKCLAFLPSVRNAQEADQWLQATKQYMSRALEGA